MFVLPPLFWFQNFNLILKLITNQKVATPVIVFILKNKGEELDFFLNGYNMFAGGQGLKPKDLYV